MTTLIPNILAMGAGLLALGGLFVANKKMNKMQELLYETAKVTDGHETNHSMADVFHNKVLNNEREIKLLQDTIEKLQAEKSTRPRSI